MTEEVLNNTQQQPQQPPSDPVEARRVQVFQAFCFQYNSLLSIIAALQLEDAQKAEVGKRFHDAMLWAKEAFILADFQKELETREASNGIAKTKDGEPGCIVVPEPTLAS